MAHYSRYVRVAVNDVEAEKQSTQDSPKEGEIPRLDKAHILEWFQKCDQSDAKWVLNRIAEIVPNLMYAAISEKVEDSKSLHKQLGKMRESISNKGLRERGRVQGFIPGDPIVQFSSSVFFAEEGVDDIMKIDVMRIGDKTGTSEVFFETEDDSAVNGKSYCSTSGKLVFEPGVALLQVEIPIINNSMWDTTTEFRCILKQEGIKGAVLGQYLYHTRVRIVDNNFFPTDQFDYLTSPQKIAEAPKWSLLFGFFKLASNVPLVWAGTVKFILVDVTHNLWYLFNLFISVYILDFIIDTSSPTSELVFIQDRNKSLMICAGLNVLNLAISHRLDYSRVTFTIAGPVRNFVQGALLRKFLNYKQSVREQLPPGNVMMGLHRDSVDLVVFGYMNILKVCSAFGKMLCMISFKLTAPYIFGGKIDWRAFALLFVIPALLMVFLRCRDATTSDALHERNKFQDDFASVISSTTSNYHLVLDYSLRNHCAHKFTEKQKRYGASSLRALQILENNMYFCKWCQTLVLAIWLLYGGMEVCNGNLKVGLFVTNLNLFTALGNAYLELYSLVVSMMNTFPALQNVTTLLNHPTDVMTRYSLKRAQRAQAKKMREDLAAKTDMQVVIDIIPIVFKFTEPFKFDRLGRSLNFNGHVEIQQDQMVAVVGPLGCGKATLLRLIAGTTLPPAGKESPIFVPAHLRIANVADEPLFFAGTLYQSLIFGMRDDDPLASIDRVKAICHRLTKSETVTDYLDHSVEAAWQDVFSAAQCKLLSIARALIHNLELLCIHKPLAKTTHDDAEHIIGALHNHIDMRGLEIGGDPLKRRPRTIIVTAASDKAVEAADSVITVDPMVGIKMLTDLDVGGG